MCENFSELLPDHVNNMCEEMLSVAEREAEQVIETRQLNYSEAYIKETEHFYVLYSYDEIVAFIEKSTNTLYDLLLFVRGYSGVSLTHINKFEKLYGKGIYGCKGTLRWKNINK